jgi:hypothetical protein
VGENVATMLPTSEASMTGTAEVLVKRKPPATH